MEILQEAQKMIEKYPLCDNCLGRQFAFLGYDIENNKRGRILKNALAMEGHQKVLSDKKSGIKLLKTIAKNGSNLLASKILERLNLKNENGENCFLCKGQFALISEIADKAKNLLSEYECETFLVGIKIKQDIEEREDEFKAIFKVKNSESMRNEFSRLIGKRLVEIIGKEVDFMNPQIVILLDPFTAEISLQVNPTFFMGRYRKLIRGIPQSIWLCPHCRGKGCSNCQNTGKMYTESVEELIGKPILEETDGKKFTFHGAGREDVDARMLGQGRPFILQIKNPKKRKLELENIQDKINQQSKGKIVVKELKSVNRKALKNLKNFESSRKTYRIIIRLDASVSDEALENLEKKLTEVYIKQRTPKRVSHRRADLIREKHIYETKIKRVSSKKIEMMISCQGGLYIKELVTGDKGRTNPSVSEILDMKAEPSELDVLEISNLLR